MTFFIATFNSLSITNFNVLDADPSTYIIVVMLMLFLFIIFSFKNDLKFDHNRKNVFYSVVVFLIYILLLSYLRSALSSAFLSYRIDAFLFPMLLLSFVILIFGAMGIKKFYPAVVYSAFASPLILLPLLNLNNAFANLNAYIIYSFVSGIGVSVAKVGLAIFSSPGSSITISSACVSIGTFVAFFMFIIPVGYFYNGKLKNKIYWILSGLALILALNLLRMLAIALVWVYYGINSAANLFHTFAGQVIFYAAIILMVFLANRFGLDLDKKISKTKISDNKHKTYDMKLFVPTAVLFIFAFTALFANMGYGNSINAQAMFFGTDLNPVKLAVNRYMTNAVANSKSDILVLQSIQNSSLFLIKNKSIGLDYSTYVLASPSKGPLPKPNNFSYNSVSAGYSFILRNGITVTSQTVKSKNYTFDINYFSIPYNVSGSWVMVNYLVFKRINESSPTYCRSISTYPQNYFESAIYNILNGGYSNNILCESYNIASS